MTNPINSTESSTTRSIANHKNHNEYGYGCSRAFNRISTKMNDLQKTAKVFTDIARYAPLHLMYFAAKNQYTSICKLLIRTGVDAYVPFIILVDKNDSQAQKTLINAGFNKQNAFFKAVFSSNIKVCQILIRAGVDVNKPNENRDTPLYKAILNDDLEICSELIKAGAKVNEIYDLGTPISIASFVGNEAICTRLIDAGADINLADRLGAIPLHVAVQKERIKICKLLLSSGSNISMQIKKGITPYGLIKSCHPDEQEKIKRVFKERLSLHLYQEAREYDKELRIKKTNGSCGRTNRLNKLYIRK